MVQQSVRSASPPRTALAFRVGIIGHRPNRLPADQERLDALRSMLRTILEEVKEEIATFAKNLNAAGLYSKDPPILRAVSPLAEGSDRMFAVAAIDLGYQLVCPMPFAQEEFENDFLPPHALENDSRERFRALLERARASAGLTKFELDGKRSASAAAYGTAGRVVLNQSDLLIAVWDGGEAAGGGGTVGTLHEAVQYRVPVLWIDALAPHQWQLLHHPDDFEQGEGNDRCVPRGAHSTDPLEARAAIAETVRRIVRAEVALPSETPGKSRTATKSQAAQYFRERRPWLNLGFVWKLFRDFVGSGTVRTPTIRVTNFEAQIRQEWPIRGDAVEKDHAAKPSAPSDLEDWVNARLRPHYAWSDKRGDLYADAYRSAYVLTYVFSAVAVGCAVWPKAMGLTAGTEAVLAAVETFLMMVVLALFVFARVRHWHDRWMEYRLLAELIRQLRILIPLGGGRPFPRLPSHLGQYGSLTRTWMYWHMRAIARTTGIPQARVMREYALQSLDYISKLVAGQLKFHQQNELRSSNIAHRLHVTSTAFFAATLVIIGLHLLPSQASWLNRLGLNFLVDRETFSGLLVVAATTLPAFAAASAGISNQGEFARLAKRSAAMAESFEGFANEIAALRASGTQGGTGPSLTEIIPLARNIAAVMIDEVADWRVVFIDRPPTT